MNSNNKYNNKQNKSLNKLKKNQDSEQAQQELKLKIQQEQHDRNQNQRQIKNHNKLKLKKMQMRIKNLKIMSKSLDKLKNMKIIMINHNKNYNNRLNQIKKTNQNSQLDQRQEAGNKNIVAEKKEQTYQQVLENKDSEQKSTELASSDQLYQMQLSISQTLFPQTQPPSPKFQKMILSKQISFEEQNEEVPKITSSISIVQDLLLNIKLAEKKFVINSIPVNYLDGLENILDMETMNLILENCKEVVVEEYIQILEKSRKERRNELNQKNYQEYHQQILKMGVDMKKIAQNGFYLLCDYLNIPQEVFQNQYAYFSDNEDYSSEFLEQLTFTQQNMKDLPPTTIRKPQGVKLLKFEINLIQNYNKNEQFKGIMKVLRYFYQARNNKPQVLPMLLRRRFYSFLKIIQE